MTAANVGAGANDNTTSRANPVKDEVPMYLAPSGTFTYGTVVAANDGKIRSFLCGLTGTESLLMAPTSTVEFVTRQSAYGPSFVPPAADESAAANGPAADPCSPGEGGTPMDQDNPLLTNTYTTSWLRFHPPASPPASAPIFYGYTVQPEASIYYSSVAQLGTGKNYPFPMALGCRVSQLAVDTSPDTPDAIPLVPYAGLSPTGVNAPVVAEDVQLRWDHGKAGTR